MSKLVEDIKSGIKGVRGAGDALRGNLMQAADEAFERDPNHPTAVTKQAENQAITEKGKQDMRRADEMFARREWEKKGVAAPGGATAAEQTPAYAQNQATGAVPSHAEPSTTSHRKAGGLHEPAIRESTANAGTEPQNAPDNRV